jgi:hypothetical protein
MALLAKSTRPSLQNKKNPKRVGGVAQLLEFLALSLTLVQPRKKELNISLID